MRELSKLAEATDKVKQGFWEEFEVSGSVRRVEPSDVEVSGSPTQSGPEETHFEFPFLQWNPDIHKLSPGSQTGKLHVFYLCTIFTSSPLCVQPKRLRLNVMRLSQKSK